MVNDTMAGRPDGRWAYAYPLTKLIRRVRDTPVFEKG